jgi:hypothetical protein
MCLDLAGDAGNYTAAIENPTGGAPQRRRYLVRIRCIWDVVLPPGFVALPAALRI